MFSFAVALAILGLVVAGLLAIPVSLVVDLERTTRVRSRIRVLWLFGWVDLELRRRSSRRGPSIRDSAAQARSVPPRSRRRPGRGPAIALALARTEGLVGRCLRLLRDLVSRLSFESAYARVEFGLDDPADTGRLYGALAPLFAVATSSRFDVWCRPTFEETCMRGACGGRIQARPIALLSAMVAFVCSRPMLRAIRAVWLARR